MKSELELICDLVRSCGEIIKNADLNFQTKDYDGFLDSFKQKINEYDGYIERSDISGGGAYDSRYTRNATIKVRIPAERYDSFMDTVVTLGSLTHRYEYIDDVTLRYVDIESRIKAYETEYDALLELLAKAENLSTGSTLSDGSLAVIVGVAALAVGIVCGFLLGKKKKSALFVKKICNF